MKACHYSKSDIITARKHIPLKTSNKNTFRNNLFKYQKGDTFAMSI